jgi:protein-S-isoprenylcysteine O-methyltransferase
LPFVFRTTKFHVRNMSSSVLFALFLIISLHPKLALNTNPLVIYSALVTLILFTIIPDFTPISLLIKHVSLFHIGEFLFVKYFHNETLSFDSFLLNNSVAYTLCMLLSFCEHFFSLTNIFHSSTVWVGLTVATLGIIIRWLALYTAGNNFTHQISHQKKSQHSLVTGGIYAVSRHPGYAGWFWWTLGLQVLVGNCFCLCLFAWVSWRFFRNRILFEEHLLVEFFGHEYVIYRDSVSVGIPFISDFAFCVLASWWCVPRSSRTSLSD